MDRQCEGSKFAQGIRGALFSQDGKLDLLDISTIGSIPSVRTTLFWNMKSEVQGVPRSVHKLQISLHLDHLYN
jgi:hypothetical protein